MLGEAVAPAGFSIVPQANLPAELNAKSLGGHRVIFKWNAGDDDDAWEPGTVWKKGPTKAEQRSTPTANAVVKFRFGAAPVELSRETHDSQLKWVLLASMAPARPRGGGGA